MPNFGLVGSIIKKPTFWSLCALTTIACAIEIGIYNILPLFLVNEHGYELTSANYFMGLSRVPSLIMVLASGWITDRLGHETLPGHFHRFHRRLPDLFGPGSGPFYG